MTRKPPKPEHDPEAMWNMIKMLLAYAVMISMLIIGFGKLIRVKKSDNGIRKENRSYSRDITYRGYE